MRIIIHAGIKIKTMLVKGATVYKALKDIMILAI